MAIHWPRAWRIIASRYPPIDLFERVSAGRQSVSDALIALEELTNPRLRDAIGEISLVPADRRVAGPGASYVMAPFTHVNRQGSRFADGSYGAYYAASELATALAETVYHFERLARDSSDPPRSEDMRVLVGELSADLHDLSAEDLPLQSRLLDPDDYAVSQAWARALRESGSNGVVYPSVRRPGGHCAAAFWPNVPAIPRQERHLQFHWNGAKVDRTFDYHADRWTDCP